MRCADCGQNTVEDDNAYWWCNHCGVGNTGLERRFKSVNTTHGAGAP